VTLQTLHNAQSRRRVLTTTTRRTPDELAKCWYGKEKHHKPRGTRLCGTQEERCIQLKGNGMTIDKVTQLFNTQWI